MGGNDLIGIPELEMRKLVGPTELSAFEQNKNENIFDELPENYYQVIFELGCGCGRLARKLIMQRTKVERYIGIDIHSGMLKWCQDNLTSVQKNFEFKKIDAFNPGLNSKGLQHPGPLPFPVESEIATLVIAISVFTHLLEVQIKDYLAECARVLSPAGLIRSTWFFFDKRNYPMMQDFQNCLYINVKDLTNAVIVDKAWFLKIASECGLVVTNVISPEIKGFQWVVDLKHRNRNENHVQFPEENNRLGIIRASVLQGNAEEIGQ
jgi:ubiquinone/menaquinone biosynthesis C-methylase UbiE